jgi:hypothetical protein
VKFKIEESTYFYNPCFFFIIKNKFQKNFILVECSEGWLTLDNACYKHESTPGLEMTPSEGMAFCAANYESQLMVPNSKQEAQFIGNYLATLKVIFYLTI